MSDLSSEVEVKARIDSVDVWRERLQKLGAKFGEVIEQADETFALPNWRDIPDDQRNILRLRQQNGLIQLTLKRSRQNELSGLEIETHVDDLLAARQIIIELGYQPQVKINKRRQVGSFGNYSICLDEVSGLGYFIELEAMLDQGQDELAVQNKMWQLLVDWGAQEDDRVTKGYDTLINELK